MARSVFFNLKKITTKLPLPGEKKINQFTESLFCKVIKRICRLARRLPIYNTAWVIPPVHLDIMENIIRTQKK
jgi:hypothetical protein